MADLFDIVVARKLSGGGGGGGAEPLIVNFTWNDDLGANALDKTAGEIRTAFESGVAVLIRAVEIDGGWSESTKMVTILDIETVKRADETEGVFNSFDILFSTSSLGTMVAESFISIEDALTKYPYQQ